MTPDEATALTQRTVGRLRAARKARGMSAQALADRCGVDRAVIASIETRRARVYLDDVARMAAALEIPLSALVADEPVRLHVSTVELP